MPMRKDDWMGSFCCAVGVLLIGLAAGIGIAEWVNSMPAAPLPPPQPPQPPQPAQPAQPVEVADKSSWELFAFILRRNLTVFVMLLFGIVSAGVVTIVVLIGNGIAIGQLVGFAKEAGLSNFAVANLLLPHGVLELGALCVAGAVGLRGVRFARRLSSLDWTCLKSLRLGLVLAFGVGALTVAAGIEAFVTAEIAESLRRKS